MRVTREEHGLFRSLPEHRARATAHASRTGVKLSVGYAGGQHLPQPLSRCSLLHNGAVGHVGGRRGCSAEGRLFLGAQQGELGRGAAEVPKRRGPGPEALRRVRDEPGIPALSRPPVAVGKKELFRHVDAQLVQLQISEPAWRCVWPEDAHVDLVEMRPPHVDADG